MIDNLVSQVKRIVAWIYENPLYLIVPFLPFAWRSWIYRGSKK